MNSIPLQAVPSQTLNVALGSQSVKLNVYQKAFGVFIDVFVNDQPIVLGVLALQGSRIVRDAYLGFSGDLAIYDTQAAYTGSPVAIVQDPVFTGLGTRFQLLYFSPADLAGFGLVA